MAHTLPADDRWTGRALRWFESRPRLTLVLLVLATLAPFLAKPFNVDDPLFLWAARQIQAHPGDPYGFDLNWYGFQSAMWDVTKNPPLACYYLAVAAAILGWSEVALHFAMLLPAVAAILGTYRLARRLCQRPVLAACTTLFTPVYLVSSTSVMCDTLLLAFWVWAVVLWIEGMESGSSRRLAGAALLVALAALTKYFGACLFPLLFIYSLVLRRRLGRWMIALPIPIALLAAYQWATHALYGRGLLAAAGAYAADVRGDAGMARTVAGLTALAFTGGCLAVVPLLALWLWRVRVLVGFLLFGILAAIVVMWGGAMSDLYGDFAGTSRMWLELQLVLWAVGGACVLALAAESAWHWRDAPSCLLALWIFGTFLFAGFVNWTINARSILPMAPAVGILLARRLTGVPLSDSLSRWTVRIALVTAAVLALAVARADFLLADSVRESARQTYAEFGHEGGTLWFQGHWGFQYYLEDFGSNAKAIDDGQSPRRGDFLAIPANNTNVGLPNSPEFHAWKTLSFDGPRGISTLSKQVGAGFYASVWGPLPFAFDSVSPEAVVVFRLGQAPPASQF